MSETRETRLKRLRIRLDALAESDLAEFEAVLEAPDQDLYAWISGARPADPSHAPVVERIRAFHGIAA